MDNFMGELKDVKVGDKLYTKIYTKGHYAPHYHVVEVKKITPTGKLRLNTGTLIDPTRTHLKPYTKEVDQERIDWNIKEILEVVVDKLLPLIETLPQ